MTLTPVDESNWFTVSAAVSLCFFLKSPSNNQQRQDLLTACQQISVLGLPKGKTPSWSWSPSPAGFAPSGWQLTFTQELEGTPEDALIVRLQKEVHESMARAADGLGLVLDFSKMRFTNRSIYHSETTWVPLQAACLTGGG